MFTETDVQGLQNIQNKTKKIITGVLFFVIFVLSYFSYYSLFRDTKNAEIPKEAQNPVTADINKVFNPTGSIYLSLSPKKEETTGIYKYSFDKKNLSPYYLPKNGTAFTGTFKGTSSDLLVAEALNNKNIQISQISSNGSSTLITNSDIKTKRHPLYSVPYNAFIYSGKEKEPNMLGKPDDFNVYLKK